jgi:CheY-like chemotaxis protein
VEFLFTLPFTKFFKAKKIRLPTSTAEIQKMSNQFDTSHMNVITDPKETEFSHELLEKIKKLGRPFIIGIIEDEAIYVTALSELINQSGELKDHIVLVEFKDANSAMEYIKTSTPDILICDVDLGAASINGFELVKKLRGEPYRYSNPICIHSNRCLPEDYERAINVGAQSFLPKPMSRIHLLKFILNSAAHPAVTTY